MKAFLVFVFVSILSFSVSAQENKVKFQVNDEDLEEGIRQGNYSYNSYMDYAKSGKKEQMVRGIKTAALAEKYLNDFYKKTPIKNSEEKKYFDTVLMGMEGLSGKIPYGFLGLSDEKASQSMPGFITYLKIIKAHLDAFEIPLLK